MERAVIDIPVNLQVGQAQSRTAVVLVLRYGNQRPPNQIPHFGGAPDHKYDHGGQLSGKIDLESPGN